MANVAAVNRSRSTIETELRFLQDSGLLNHNQMQSIMAQLPVNGQSSQYTDYGDDEKGGQRQQPISQHYSQQPLPQPQHYPTMPPPNYSPQPGYAQVAQAAQNPDHPANPNNPKHNEWLNSLGKKFGNAVVWGGGATLGSDLMNDALHKVGL